MGKILKALAISCLFLSFGASAQEEKQNREPNQRTRFITIGTGGITGVYYPTGGAISKIVNKKRRRSRIRTSVESTAGSVFNVNAVLSGDLDFGIVQSDRQHQAIEGLAEWKARGPQKNLRSVFSLHSEVVTIVAAVDSKIRSIKDFRSKRINIGSFGSGQRQNAIDVLNANGLNWEKDFKAEALKSAEAPKMLQDHRIDAFFFTVGHPSGTITEATSGKRKVRFIPVSGMQRLLKQFPYYSSSRILRSHYPMAQGSGNIPAIGMKATFITSSNVPEDVVYTVVKEIFENFDEFKTSHPALANLDKKDMLSGLSAPLHPGAIKYYKEAKMNIPERLLK